MLNKKQDTKVGRLINISIEPTLKTVSYRVADKPFEMS